MNTTCPKCGHQLSIKRGVGIDADTGEVVTITAAETPPTPGSISCCFACVTWLRVGDDMMFHEATEAELSAIDADAPDGFRDMMEREYRRRRALPQNQN